MPVAVGIDLHPASTYYTFKPILYVIGLMGTITDFAAKPLISKHPYKRLK